MKIKNLSVIFAFALLVFSFSYASAAKTFIPSIMGVVKSAYTSTDSSPGSAEALIVEDKKLFSLNVVGAVMPKFVNFSQVYQNYLAKQKQTKAAKQKAKQQELGQVSAVLEGKYIDIDVSTQTLTMFQDKVAISRFKISSGGSKTPTPLGTFKIRDKRLRAYSKKYDLYMPYWMGFTSSGHGIHELPEYKNGHKEGAASIGRAVSHGCVRLPVGNAVIVYNWVSVGDTVYVHK